MLADYRHGLQCSALPVPCSHRCLRLFLVCFFGVVFGVVFFFAPGRVQVDFGAQHGPNLGPFWSHVGYFLGPFWVLLWHLHSRCDFDRFLIDFRPPRTPKNIEKPMVFWRFLLFCSLALETDSGPILGWFWIPKSTQNRQKIDPKFNKFLDHFFDWFWSPLGVDLIRFWGPKWSQNWSRIGLKSDHEANVKMLKNHCFYNDFEDPRCPESIKNRSQDDVRLRCKIAPEKISKSGQHGSKIDPKWNPSWLQNRWKMGSKMHLTKRPKNGLQKVTRLCAAVCGWARQIGVGSPEC